MYKVIISNQAYEDIDLQLEYIERRYRNTQAIESILADIDLVLRNIEYNPEIYSDYIIQGSKRAHLPNHNYKFIYSINKSKSEVHIDRFIHDLQDSKI